MRLLFIIWLILAFSTEAQEIDAVSGLIKNPGWKLVNANCSACHSIKLVPSNSGNRDEWLNTIRWMQETQKLWQFDPTTEDTILTYLATNYPAIKPSRRAAIPSHLMPE